MFSSNPLDKSCIGPDCSSGRSNASNRFPVGITSLGDENQQIRIQLAVHKYNSSANTPLNNRCAVISPFRHSFLNNSHKTKNYEGEAEGISKGEKRNGNQYEGVGAFPTIHLKKSAVRYRPIKRFNGTKISYPELPVNRFLSNLPEACSDTKSTTRSVLDVLEDLSGKNIHSKDDNGNNKPKSKGLGGDYVLNQNTVYKPLFVQKPKISSVLTRDNTTQTLSTPDTETPNSKNNNSFVRNDTSDPRAELRRKLAKQNNEIFASLSSSISSTFSLKRKIDEVTPVGDEESLTDGSGTKALKMDHHPNNYNGNGVPKSLNRTKTYLRDSVKTNRKSQLKEANPATSPNKDRLTTIFLDMQQQNTSRKSQIFQSTPTLPGANPGEKASQAPTNLSNGLTSASNGFDNKIPNSIVKGSTGTGAVEEGADKTALNNSACVSVAEKTGTDTKKAESEQVSKPVFNFPISTTVAQPTTFQFGINNASSSNQAVSQGSNQSSSDSGGVAEKPVSETGKKTDQSSDFSKAFVFGSPNNKPNFTAFKFGTDGNTSSTVTPTTNNSKALPSETVQVTATTMPITTPQFCFGANSNATTSAPQSLTPQFEIKSSQNTLIPPTKPLFTFGQSPSPAPQITGAEQKTTVPSTSSTTTSQSIQSAPFIFGAKPVSPILTTSGQTVASEAGPKNETSNTLALSASSSIPAPVETSKPMFSFGQKAETPTTSTASGSITQEPKFTFSFGQKPGVDQNKPQQEFGQKSTNLFTFGQKSVPQETQNAATTAVVTSPSQPGTSQTTSVFGQSVPQVASSPQMKFGQISPSQIPNTFGAKSEATTLGSISTPALSQSTSSFPIKTSLFGPSGNGFGTSSTQTTAGLRTSTSNTSGFAFGTSATTQSSSTFVVSSASQATPTFGGPSTTPAMSGFGGPSTSQSTTAFGTSASTPSFGVTATAQSTTTFPVPTTTQSGSNFGATTTTPSVPTFGTASSSQSTPSFGISSTTQSSSTFAVSSAQQSTVGFGTSSTTQSTPAFGASTGFGVSTSSQSNNMFGAPAPTQSAVRFGAPLAQNIGSFGASTCFSSASSTQPSTTFGSPAATSTSGFGTSQSFAQPFNKPATSLIPTSSIFGQTPAPSFTSSSTFNTNQNNVFGQKANSEGDMFDQNKIQTQGFGTTSQSFGSQQNKFPFGMSTSNATGFTTSPPNTTSPPVFSFGSSSTTANTFTFGSGSSMSSNSQAPFAFKSPTANEPFKFGATTSAPATGKEGTGFGGGNPGTFNFGGQMNNNNSSSNNNNNNNNNNSTMTEQKPPFTFGNAQVSSSGPFAFGTTPSPSVFSFGSTGSGSSGSSFNFGTPSPGGGFGQTPSSVPGAPFPVPGTFSIGSGSSQSRPRATSRPRRRP